MTIANLVDNSVQLRIITHKPQVYVYLCNKGSHNIIACVVITVKRQPSPLIGRLISIQKWLSPTYEECRKVQTLTND